MANLKENIYWEEGIYQFETSDPVLGGENGIDNLPTRQLANRTQWLKENKLDKKDKAQFAESAEHASTSDTAKKLAVPKKIGGVSFDGSTDINLAGVNILGNQDTTGNAATASKLQTTRFINGIAFDGTKDINVTPAGAVQYFAMPNPPTGWLVADGSTVARDQYKDLFAVIGTFYGAGDGKTTFNIPDLRGEFVRSWDAGRGIDKNRIFGSWQTGTPISHDDEALPEWFDVVAMSYSARSYGDEWVGQLPVAFTSQPYTYTVAADRPQFFTMTRPRNVALLCCIKY